MVIDTIPLRFGEATDIDIEAVFRKDGIIPSNYKTSSEPLKDLSGQFKETLFRIFKSITHSSLDNIVRIYFEDNESFEANFNDGPTVDYRSRVNVSNVPAFLQGYRVFLRKGFTRGEAFVYLMHEIGGATIPTEIKKEKTNVVTKPKTNLPFLIEVSQFFLQYSGMLKWSVERSEDISTEHDLKDNPVHYHASLEALRLLKNRKTPLQTYPDFYSGDKKPEKNLILVQSNGESGPIWVDQDNPLYNLGGVVRFNSRDYVTE